MIVIFNAHDLAVQDLNDLVGKFRHMRIVRDHDERFVPCAHDVTDGIHHVVGSVRVQISRGFVRKHDVRIRHERARDANALLLAAAHLRRLVLQMRFKPHGLERLAGKRIALACGHAAERKRERHVFERRIIRH